VTGERDRRQRKMESRRRDALEDDRFDGPRGQGERIVAINVVRSVRRLTRLAVHVAEGTRETKSAGILRGVSEDAKTALHSSSNRQSGVQRAKCSSSNDYWRDLLVVPAAASRPVGESAVATERLWNKQIASPERSRGLSFGDREKPFRSTTHGRVIIEMAFIA